MGFGDVVVDVLDWMAVDASLLIAISAIRDAQRASITNPVYLGKAGKTPHYCESGS
jgi:hypothetical protein